MPNFEKWLENKKKCSSDNDAINNDNIIKFLENLKELLFPSQSSCTCGIEDYLDLKLSLTKYYLSSLLTTINNISKLELDNIKIIDSFLSKLPLIDDILKTDIEAIFEGDPAAENYMEIISCYPGFLAIFIYRVAHALYELEIPVLPRVISEYAHKNTGIDIHPGAQIGSYFFIDHGTGIVIGQTTIIGDHVKIYQGVTLGALSLREGQKLKGKKRHPTIEDYVTIYSGASIFGGDTVIGKNTTIGSNAYITESVDSNMSISISGQRKKHIEL